MDMDGHKSKSEKFEEFGSFQYICVSSYFGEVNIR